MNKTDRVSVRSPRNSASVHSPPCSELTEMTLLFLLRRFWQLEIQLIGALPPPAGLECGTKVWLRKIKKEKDSYSIIFIFVLVDLSFRYENNCTCVFLSAFPSIFSKVNLSWYFSNTYFNIILLFSYAWHSIIICFTDSGVFTNSMQSLIESSMPYSVSSLRFLPISLPTPTLLWIL